MWILLILVTAVILWLSVNQRYRWIYIACKTFPRDIKITVLYIKIYLLSNRIFKQKLSLAKVFDSLVEKHPQKIAIYFEDEKWTYAQLGELSNKVTRYFQNNGFKKGDTVALLMENCPEYPCIFVGLSRLGVVTALINTNLVKGPLLHSITVVNPKAVIVSSSYKDAIKEISASLPQSKLCQFNKKADTTEMLTDFINLKQELNNVSGNLLHDLSYKAEPKDPVVYIYTSGTTGLPKASVLTQLRLVLGAKTFQLVGGLTQDDILYVPLPLYHTTGGMLGLGQALIAGVTVVIRKKFSATSYFEDCVRYNVTVAQYVGEMCRYILATQKEAPKNHKVRLMFGNGLKPQIWKAFVTKFNIKHVIELYGSTEGVSNLVNIDNKIGAVGYIPWFLRKTSPLTLLKCDKDYHPIRNAEDRCIECSANEPGVAVGKIDPKQAILNFEGYTDKKATEEKILRNVFTEGDMYFNSGDILEYDEFGYIYFKDRIGDTFRWKGENVSTTEVEAVISNLVQLADVVVYGVEVPHTEGRAGMAVVLDPDDKLDIDSLGSALKSHLPSYAIPIFIRLAKSVPLTGTYKLKKVDLRNEGFDIEKIKDKIYYFDAKLGKYVILSQSLYENIKNGAVRL